MSRITRSTGRTSNRLKTDQPQSSRSTRGRSSKTSDSSLSTMDSHPTQTTFLSEKKKSVYSEVEDEVANGKTSTEAVMGNPSYLYSKDSESEEEELFPKYDGFRTPDWRSKKVPKHEDYVDNIRQVLCSSVKKKPETASKTTASTPYMSTIQSRLLRKASIAAEQEMAQIERRVSLKKMNESINGLNQSTVNTPAGRKSFIDLSKIQSCSKATDEGIGSTPDRSFLHTRNINTPASSVSCSSAKPLSGVKQFLNNVSGVEDSPSSHFLSKTAATPVSTFGVKRLTMQRASLDMSTILKGVVAYVEVRTNHDNMSQGVKSHVRTLGAAIEENFTRKVTHVIFKEGMMSTYKKAEQWGIPLVSVLWIEACKTAGKVVPTDQFPPIDIDRYKNALPFKRFRKKRSIQPEFDRRLPKRNVTRKLNKLSKINEKQISNLTRKKSSIRSMKNDVNAAKQIEDKYLQALITLAGPFLEEALNRSDSPTNEGGDSYLPLSVRLLKKYMTPRGSQSESKFPRVSDLEKHLNLNQKGRSRLRKFLVFTSEDEVESENADKSTQTDESSMDESISPVPLPRVLRKSAPARLFTAHKKRAKNKTKTTTVKKPIITERNNKSVNKRTSVKAKTCQESTSSESENKENINNKKNEKLPSNKEPSSKVIDGQIVRKNNKTSAVKRKILPTDQMIILDKPVDDLSISKPVPKMYPPHLAVSPKKKKVNGVQIVENKNSDKRFSEMYGILSSDDERRSSAWFAPPKRNKTPPKPVLVCTSLHSKETEEVNMIIDKLGLFDVNSTVNAQTTHILAGGPRRTLNLIKGLARGCWIVRLDWALDSLKAGKWLYEEPYELTEFSPAVKEIRILRQSFKFLFSLDIFATCGSIYVCQKTVPPREDLKEILRLCSAVIVSSHKSAQIIIGNNVAGKYNVQEKWVLDCVSQNKLIDFKSYIIKNSDIK